MAATLSLGHGCRAERLPKVNNASSGGEAPALAPTEAMPSQAVAATVGNKPIPGAVAHVVDVGEVPALGWQQCR